MTPRPRVKLFRTVSQAAVRAFASLMLLALLLAGASSWLAVRAVQGEIRSRASLTQLCRSGNEARAEQVRLWDHLAALSTPPRETAARERARQAALAGLLRYVRQVFAARDCGPGQEGTP